MTDSDIKRFMNKVAILESCWIWTSTRQVRGYGKMWLNGKQQSAHRISYKIFNGEINEGMVIMHSCDNTSCVNPEHLTQGTTKENSIDREKKGRSRHRVLSLKSDTLCYVGHRKKLNSSGRCMECSRITRARSKSKIKELKMIESVFNVF